VPHKCFLGNSAKGREPCLAVIVLAAVLFLTGVTPSRAGTLDMIVENTTAAPGTSGQFDVILRNNSAATATIGSFGVDVLQSSTSAVSFTAIDNNTTAPYIFNITGSFPPGFQPNLLPMEASGNDLAASGGQVLNPGDTFGLVHVRYLVDPGAIPGTVVGISLEQFPIDLPPPGGTSLADDLGNPVPFTSVNGTITIQSPAVPEPASVTMLAISGAIVLLGARFSRRGRRHLIRD
jgi:hypothetical protein